MATKIGRIRHGEVIIVQQISEDLQDRWHHQEKLADDMNLKREMLDEALIKLHMRREVTGGELDADLFADVKKKSRDAAYAEGRFHFASKTFWVRLNERYDTWGKPIGLRDGFAIVQIPYPPVMQIPV